MIPSIERIERGAYRTWSPDETVDIGGWTVGSNGGFTRRANSANAWGPADTSPETGDRIREWLGQRNARMAVRVTPLMHSSTESSASREWDLRPVDETPVLVREITQSVTVPPDVELVSARDPVFADQLVTMNGRPPWVTPIWSRLVDRLDGPHSGIWVPGRAVGFVAVTDGIGFVYSVAVDVSHRRRGLATRIMGAAHAFAADRGGRSAVLQVLGTNAAALRLYFVLGYEERYRYRYLQGAPSSPA